MVRPSSTRLACAACFTAALWLTACGEIKPVTSTRAPKTCRVAPGPAPAQCRLMGSDADWLPPAYVRNAACRCQRTPNSPSANCVRGKLDAMLFDVPTETREAWRQQKNALHDSGRRNEYERWVRETAGREIYRWHVRAHAECCCQSALPPYEQWSAVVTAPFDSCSQARALSDFGSCRGAPGRW